MPDEEVVHSPLSVCPAHAVSRVAAFGRCRSTTFAFDRARRAPRSTESCCIPPRAIDQRSFERVSTACGDLLLRAEMEDQFTAAIRQRPLIYLHLIGGQIALRVRTFAAFLRFRPHQIHDRCDTESPRP